MNKKVKSLLERLSNVNHRGGAFSSDVLIVISEILIGNGLRTLETGCGKSTIMFSNISQNHYVFTYDDSLEQDSSVRMVKEDQDFIAENVKFVYGPTQRTLLKFEFSEEDSFDVILLDGPHGYPFPDLEYGILYDRLKSGGILIIDDIHIPSIGRMYEILREDRMYEEVGVFSTTGVLKRTVYPGVSSEGDHWWEQGYNVKRFPTYDQIRKPNRNIKYNQIIDLSNTTEIERLTTKGFCISILQDGATTTDLISVIECVLPNEISSMIRCEIEYRSEYIDASNGSFVKIYDQLVPLDFSKEWTKMA
jgi:SAM-dependent methyltransferase